jgi:hypothetical protein
MCLYVVLWRRGPRFAFFTVMREKARRPGYGTATVNLPLKNS